ncbi:MAG: 30S ribosome-binding factor RbfA [Chloroflexi bacterium]|nr:30S ribosome-binding factor RbfA [Chloroflexota bacterium]
MSIKTERAGRLILEIVSELLMSEVTDPALTDVTVVDVTVDREIEYAEVYVHSMEDRKVVMAGLERASGFLRHELAVRTRFRKTPVLRFYWDDTLDRGERIEELLQKLHTSPDAETPAKEPNDDDDPGLG